MTIQTFDPTLGMDPITHADPDPERVALDAWSHWHAEATDPAPYDRPYGNVTRSPSTQVTLNTGIVDGRTVYYLALRYPDGTVQADMFEQAGADQ